MLEFIAALHTGPDSFIEKNEVLLFAAQYRELEDIPFSGIG